ncbi:MAG: DUF4198 domain-containing protein [Planctomycetes bacterium]|nr:DUF4198 domain-containing protein [Planctomycetota bacterium]
MKYSKMTCSCAFLMVFCMPGGAVFGATGMGHELHLFVSVAGENITGYTYYQGGERVVNVDIEIWGAGDDIVFMGKTDEKGEFIFKPTYQSDYKVVAMSVDGHRAEQEIKASALPSGLPEKGEVVENPLSGVPAFGWSGAEADAGEIVIAEESLRAILDESVARQVRPLQEQLAEYESKVRIRDVVGGLGFICGLAGVGMIFASKKQK